METNLSLASVTRRPLGTLGRVVSCAAGKEDEHGRVDARIMLRAEWFPAASNASTARRYDLPQASARTVKLVPAGRLTRLPRLYTQ